MRAPYGDFDDMAAGLSDLLRGPLDLFELIGDDEQFDVQDEIEEIDELEVET